MLSLSRGFICMITHFLNRNRDNIQNKPLWKILIVHLLLAHITREYGCCMGDVWIACEKRMANIVWMLIYMSFESGAIMRMNELMNVEWECLKCAAKMVMRL